MKKHVLVGLIVIIQLLGYNYVMGQNNRAGFYLSTSGELPTYNLNKTDILSQQYNIAFGYAFPKNTEVFFNSGMGVFGKESDDLCFTKFNTSFGVGGNCLFMLSPVLEVGPEVLVGYGYSDIVDDLNYDHAIYQAGIKFQSSDPVFGQGRMFGVLGLRYRSFFDYGEMNSLELYYGIGIRFGLTSKTK